MRQITGLESAKLKLIRASEHIKRIGQQVAAYSGSDSHTVVTLPHGTDRISVREEPPLGISILARRSCLPDQVCAGSLGVRSGQAQSYGRPTPRQLGGFVLFPVVAEHSQEAHGLQLFLSYPSRDFQNGVYIHRGGTAIPWWSTGKPPATPRLSLQP